MKTVKEVSELTGISIRALRYYDEIGLLDVADGMSLENDPISFELFHEEDAEKVAEGILQMIRQHKCWILYMVPG